MQKPTFNKCIPRIPESFVNDDDLLGYTSYATFAAAKERPEKFMPERDKGQLRDGPVISTTFNGYAFSNNWRSMRSD